MNFLEILDELYFQQRQERMFDLYNQVFTFLAKDDHGSVSSLIRKHAARTFVSLKLEDINAAIAFFKQLSQFFTAISELFCLFDDYMRILLEKPSYSRFLYVQALNLDHEFLVHLFLRSYAASPQASRELYVLIQSTLSPFTEPFDASLTTILTSDFKAFLDNRAKYDHKLPEIAIQALNALRDFSQYCGLQKKLFYDQLRAIQTVLIQGNETRFLEQAIASQNSQFYKEAAQAGSADFRAKFADYVNQLTDSAIRKASCSEIDQVVKQFTELFAAAFDSDSAIAESYLASNIRFLKAEDYLFQFEAVEGLFRGNVHHAQYISKDAAVLLLLIYFAFYDNCEYRNEIACQIRRQNAYYGQVLQFIAAGSVLRMRRHGDVLDCIQNSEGILLLGKAEISVDDRIVVVPSLHGLILASKFDIQQLNVLELRPLQRLLVAQCVEIIQQAASQKQIELHICPSCTGSSAQKPMNFADIAAILESGAPLEKKHAVAPAFVVNAAVAGCVKRLGACSEAELHRQLTQYTTEQITSALAALDGEYLEVNDAGQITWAD